MSLLVPPLAAGRGLTGRVTHGVSWCPRRESNRHSTLSASRHKVAMSTSSPAADYFGAWVTTRLAA
ncbi:MAG TPA: hypothetical protein VH520_09945 [Streptosporangiaceae bacterium]